MVQRQGKVGRLRGGKSAGTINVLLLAASMLVSGCAQQKLDLTENADSRSLRQALYRQFDAWRSVRYRWGGLSQAGVDCSGLVYLTYRDLFDLTLPRTTAQQAAHGVEVTQLEAGDLVFFKTGHRRRHVGIYLEQGRFLHVSSRRGVVISSLDNPYWSKKYWKAVRVFNASTQKLISRR
ncbi:MAG: glycoside hydrolase [Gammaproteobacteria bacterium HGW-Gammaproteobacteria-3]|nr:MAG: glycoside hydrolase [Gammaproteobacteria bacterium HGW-Gammaproteobacteria-3]